jgi:hypothetical protein
MTTLRVKEHTGGFAEDKDVARALRTEHIEPALKRRSTVTIDFEGVDGATQSFVHAMISHPIRTSRGKALDRLRFKNCAPPVREIIAIVCEYSQDTAE